MGRCSAGRSVGLIVYWKGVSRLHMLNVMFLCVSFCSACRSMARLVIPVSEVWKAEMLK